MNLLAHAEDTSDPTAFVGHHQMMGFSQAGGSFFNYYFVLSTATWVLFIILLLVLIRYFWTKSDGGKK